jgi:alpha-glucosidase (family GH31 glycosyl hydrolase)
MFPDDPKGFSLDEQYYIGDSGLLVKPITAPGITQTTVYLAEAQVSETRNPFCPMSNSFNLAIL